MYSVLVHLVGGSQWRAVKCRRMCRSLQEVCVVYGNDNPGAVLPVSPAICDIQQPALELVHAHACRCLLAPTAAPNRPSRVQAQAAGWGWFGLISTHSEESIEIHVMSRLTRSVPSKPVRRVRELCKPGRSVLYAGDAMTAYKGNTGVIHAHQDATYHAFRLCCGAVGSPLAYKARIRIECQHPEPVVDAIKCTSHQSLGTTTLELVNCVSTYFQSAFARTGRSISSWDCCVRSPLGPRCSSCLPSSSRWASLRCSSRLRFCLP